MVVVRATLGQAPDAGDDPATRFVPMLDRDPDRPTTNRPFDPWWRDPFFEPNAGHAFCRWDFVNGIAHKEGGAHIDPTPALSWVVLRDQQWDAVTSAVNARVSPFRFAIQFPPSFGRLDTRLRRRLRSNERRLTQPDSHKAVGRDGRGPLSPLKGNLWI
jgi:hypothetical protein